MKMFKSTTSRTPICILMLFISSIAGAQTTVNLSAAEDTYLRGGQTTYNQGATTPLIVNGSSSRRQVALLKWNLSGIPSGATITAVTLTLNVSNTSVTAFELYDLKRTWVEGNLNGTASSSSNPGANWGYANYQGGIAWGTAGAQSTSADRNNTNLWGAGALSSGSNTVSLNSSGVSVVQSWLNTPSGNYGFILQNFTSSTDDQMEFSSSEGVNPPQLNVTYTSSSPTITTTGTLSAFTSEVGVPSAEQSYTVAGTNLTGNINITAPSDFQISTTSGSGFTSSLTLTQTGGTVSPTTIYARFNRSTAGTSTGNITHTSSGATQKDIAVSGTALLYYNLTANTDGNGTVVLNPSGGRYASGTEVTLTATGNSGYMFTAWSGDLTGSTNPTTITMNGDKTVSAAFSTGVSLNASEDTYMRGTSANYTQNNGGNTTISQSPNTDARRNSLYRWDLSSITPGVTVVSASLTFYVTDASAFDFSLFRMRRGWVEGNSTDAASSTSANWNTYDGVNSWGTGGAMNTTSDRYDTDLWDATAATFGTTGSVTIPLNASGLAAIQDWINSSSVNFGFTIQYMGTGTDGDYWNVSSSEATTVANRPKLNIIYSSNPNPTIVIEGTLSPFTTQPGVASAAQTYTVSGSGLTGNIAITAPTGFELSTNNTTFNPSLTLTPTGGNVASTTIYVRLYSTTDGNYSGNIAHTSSGATDQNLAVSGSVAYTIVLQDGLNAYSGTRDTYTYTSNPSTAHGSDTTFVQDVNTSDERRSLLLFDLSSVPAGTSIQSATLQFYVAVEGQGFNMYRMKTAWDEATVTYASLGNRHFAADGADAETAVNANWPGNDGYVGLITVSVPSSTIQDWIDGVMTNNGWLMIATDASDGQQLRAREHTVQAHHPKLTIEYLPNTTDPIIFTSGTLTPFTSTAGVPSASQTYTVSGKNLTENISLSAPAGFGLSTNGSTFSSSLVLPHSGGVVSSTTIYVRLFSSGKGSFSGNITHTSSGATTRNIAVSGTVGNSAPYQPLLVAPADGATGVSSTPALTVTVSDPDASDNLNVSFYGREYSTSTPGADFTIAVIPDPQNFSDNVPSGIYSGQTQWIVDNKNSSNIVFSTCVGDLVNTSTNASEYSVADAAFDILDAGGVPYGVTPGNHDMGSGSLWPSYFGASRFSGKGWYGGSYDDYNSYSHFSASGNDFILINLQYSPSTAILDWADGLLKANSGRRGIVVQHDILNTDNSWANQASYTALKDNPNLFLMLCGHMHSGSDGAAYRAELGDDSHTIHIVMADYQDFTAGYLRLLRFSPANDKVYMTTFAPFNSASITTDPDQKELVYDLGNAGPSYVLIGTRTGVTNGANAAVTWANRLGNTKYEWYTTVSDGNLTTTGPTWTFTTNEVSWVGGTAGNPTDWNTPANWSSGLVPSAATNLTIPEGSNDPVISSGTMANCHNIILESGATLTIQSDNTSSGSLIVSGTVTGAGAGNITYNRWMRADDYQYFSTPVGGQAISGWPAERSATIYDWDEVTTGDWRTPVPESASALIPGKGYSWDQGASVAGTVAFTGTIVTAPSVPATSPYTADVNTTLTDAGAVLADYDARWANASPKRANWGGGGWNLLGNPFTSAMDATVFINTNEASFDPNYKAVYIYGGNDGGTGEGVYYYIGMDGGDWTDTQFGNNIQVGQGFFVLDEKQDNVEYSFTGNNIQVHATSVQLKTARIPSWPGLRLKVTKGDKERSTLIIYNKIMTAGLDPGYDIGQLTTDTDLNIYTSLVNDNGVSFARQALPLYNNSKNTIPVGIDALNGGTVTFSSYMVPIENGSFYLEDRVEGKLTDLSKENYTVTLAEKTMGTGRFFIHTSPLTDLRGPISGTTDLNLSIWKSQNMINIQGNVSDKAVMAVYDLLGRKIHESRLTDNHFNSITLPVGVKGVYLIDVRDGSKKTIQKVVI